MIYYNLNKDISLEKIGKDLHKLFSQIPKDELQHLTLVISLQKILDYAGDSPLSKINYEGDSLT